LEKIWTALASNEAGGANLLLLRNGCGTSFAEVLAT